MADSRDPTTAAATVRSLRHRIHELLEPAGTGDRASRAVDIFIVTLIALNVVALVLETVEPVRRAFPALFPWFERWSVAVFSVEYVLRLWSATADPRYASPIRGRLRFARSPLAVIDLLAILPAYLPFVGIDLRVIRAARLFRIFRLAKLARYSRALQMFGRVIAAKKEELVTTFMLLLLLLLVAASMLYFAEHRAQPDVFPSIPAAMWWGVVTITTVGYGDVYPVTVAGRAIAAVVAILGLGMFALPTGLLGAGFVEEMDRRKHTSSRRCPHCGEAVDAG